MKKGNWSVLEVIAIGNELITGLIADTNSGTISRRLSAVGVRLSRSCAVGDDPDQITRALREALDRVDVVVLTGGLGPTHDDITKAVLVRFFESKLVKNKTVEKNIERIFGSRGSGVPEMSLSQAEVPDNATILHNEKGTAPGLLFESQGKRVYSLPGVPLELEYLLDKYIVPDLEPEGTGKISYRILHTTGIPESALWEEIGPVAPLEEWVQVASLPSLLGVRLRLTAQDLEDTSSKLDQAEAYLRKKIGHHVYGVDHETLEEVIGRIVRDRHLTLSVAESCTGGLISHRLTNIAGSSDYLLECAVTYSNAAKEKRLGVDSRLIENHGAVSREVALAMAEGIRKKSGSDLGLAVTGIAGPGGGSAEKPVGLTFIAVADREHSHCEKFNFHQDRVRNKERAAQAALNSLRLNLLKSA